jgi:hypothetical protein
MKRAIEVFTFEVRKPTSSLIHQTWATASAAEEPFVSVADVHWEMVVTRQRGNATLTVRGPEVRATPAPVPRDAEFFGIQFALGTFLPALPLRSLVGGGVTLPPLSRTSFWLGGDAWELPGPDDAEVFVERLARAGLLVHDPLAAAAVAGDDAGVTTRTVERRVARATGLTRGTIRQIRRAEQAVGLLEEGVRPLDAARRAGYADQAHLTRSLRRFMGVTPSGLADPAGH